MSIPLENSAVRTGTPQPASPKFPGVASLEPCEPGQAAVCAPGLRGEAGEERALCPGCEIKAGRAGHAPSTWSRECPKGWGPYRHREQTFLPHNPPSHLVPSAFTYRKRLKEKVVFKVFIKSFCLPQSKAGLTRE